jgi:MFS transporter, Spinster family, sphingosine-1-phosphate transporter
MRDGGGLRKNYVLYVLLAVLVVNSADRLVFGVVLQDIKVELGLSDTQLGLLTGIAFSFFYATMGIPLARLADRGNRVSVIAACTILWSVAVGLCGLARNFMQLMVMRMGVAVGEAGCYAPSLSLISDHYSRAERPRAISRYMLAFPISVIVALPAAGWLNQLYGWRITFLVFAAPGLLLGPLAWLTLKDNRMRSASGSDEPEEDAPPLRAVVPALWRNRTFRNLFLCFSVWGFFAQGISQWQPAFFLRSHHLSTGEMGTWLALVSGVGGLVGTILGGELAARFAADDERRQVLGLAAVYAALGLLFAGVYAATDYRVAFALIALCSLISGAGNGPLFGTIQSVVAPRMRAMAVAILYLFTNLIGLGLGPLAVGALSDRLRPALGDESLRLALLVFCPGYLWCAWHLLKASRTVVADVRSTEARIREGSRSDGEGSSHPGQGAAVSAPQA